MYSTQDVHPRERLSYWLEMATRGYVEHSFRAEDPNTFHGSVEISSLPGIGLSKFTASPAHVRRSNRNAARADSGDVLVTMQCTGEAFITQDGNDALIRGRAMFLVDPLRPFEITLRARSTHIVAKVPRAMLEARVGNIAALTAKPITTSTGIGTLAMGFLELVPDQAQSLDNVSGLKIADQVMDLLALAFSNEGGLNPALSSPRSIALVRLKATIERLLIEPGLKPERVAGETGISVRYANALLAEEHTSIERYIAERRLERCRSALEDAAQSHRSIGEIAYKWGFSDLSPFGRRFKARYGLTPTDYRRQIGQITAEKSIARSPAAFARQSRRLIAREPT